MRIQLLKKLTKSGHFFEKLNTLAMSTREQGAHSATDIRSSRFRAVLPTESILSALLQIPAGHAVGVRGNLLGSAGCHDAPAGLTAARP